MALAFAYSDAPASTPTAVLKVGDCGVFSEGWGLWVSVRAVGVFSEKLGLLITAAVFLPPASGSSEVFH